MIKFEFNNSGTFMSSSLIIYGHKQYNRYRCLQHGCVSLGYNKPSNDNFIEYYYPNLLNRSMTIHEHHICVDDYT